MPVSQQDIAERLNVSRATVSRSLNHAPGIDPQTRGKVLAMASQLGYRRSRRGRPGVHHQSNDKRIGVFVVEGAGEFAYGSFGEHDEGFVDRVAAAANGPGWPTDARFSDVGAGFLSGISDAAHDLGASLDLRYVEPAQASRLLSAVPTGAAARHWLGALLIYPIPNPIVQQLADRCPCVSLVNRYEGVALDCVDSNQAQAIMELVRHLHSLGHRRIGFLAKAHTGWTTWCIARYGGYVQGLAACGLQFDPDVVINMQPGDVLEPARQAVRVAELAGRGVTAWVCTTDRDGYELIAHLRPMGVRVPGDVSITGFDGLQPLPNMPALTTASPPVRDMGYTAVRRLVDRCRHPASPIRHNLLECRFVEGQTAAPPPSEVAVDR